MKKDELLMVFPTPVQIYKYEDSIEKELKYIEGIDWLPQVANGNFKTKDSYLTKHEQLKKLVSFFLKKYLFLPKVTSSNLSFKILSQKSNVLYFPFPIPLKITILGLYSLIKFIILLILKSTT